MKRIPIHVMNNVSGQSFDCNIIEGKSGWNCMVHQEYFSYQFLRESTLIQCIDTLAAYLEPYNNITVFGETDSDMPYVALLDSKIRKLKSKKDLQT